MPFSNTSGPKTVDDNTIMYFGARKGKKMIDVPDSYLLYILKQNWIKDHPALYKYLLDVEETLEEDS